MQSFKMENNKFLTMQSFHSIRQSFADYYDSYQFNVPPISQGNLIQFCE